MQNDFEIAGQLDLLSKKISEGITGANKVLEQVRKVELDVSSAEKAKAEIAEVIEVEISRAKSEALTQLEEIRELTEQNQSTYNKFLQEKLELNELYTLFESLIKEIGGAAGLKELRRELQEGREVAFKLETYHQQENQKLLLEKMAQQQQQFIRQGKLEQENQKLLLEKMAQQQQQLIGEGKLAIVIVSVSVLLISLIK
jgi:hypothetical protein